jgi:hypothetical protein
MSAINLTTFTFKILTVNQKVTNSDVGRFLTKNAQGQDDLEFRIHVLLSDYAEEHELGYIASEDGFTHLLYEKPFLNEEIARTYL